MTFEIFIFRPLFLMKVIFVKFKKRAIMKYISIIFAVTIIYTI